jgi:hypothetical protein
VLAQHFQNLRELLGAPNGFVAAGRSGVGVLQVSHEEVPQTSVAQRDMGFASVAFEQGFDQCDGGFVFSTAQRFDLGNDIHGAILSSAGVGRLTQAEYTPCSLALSIDVCGVLRTSHPRNEVNCGARSRARWLRVG